MDMDKEMEAIYMENARLVYKYLLSLCHDENLAEDIMQDTFVQAVKKIGQYKGNGKLSTWLCSIARNLLYDWYRKHPKEMELNEEVQGKEDEREDGSLFAAIHQLPQPYQEVLYLRSFGSLSYAKIAEIFGKSENWARVTYFRAKEKLKAVMEHE